LRKITIMIMLLLLLGFGVGRAEAYAIKGEAYLLFECATGEILMQKNGSSRLFPASTTKILTAVLALEKGDLQEEVVISRQAMGVIGSKLDLRITEKTSLEDLLYALLLYSANDAAVAIAEHISGSVDSFVLLMNDKAKALGAERSHFTNPHGLTSNTHYTTAEDLARITAYAMKNEKFREIVETKEFLFSTSERRIKIENRNRLLWSFAETTGVKTGYTTAARYTLVASAKNGERELIAVILGSDDERIWEDAEKLLDYGLYGFKLEEVISDSESFKINAGWGQNIVAHPEKDVQISLSLRAEPRIEKIVLPKRLKYPLAEGQVVGELLVRVDETERARVKLLANEAVEKESQNYILAVILIFIFLELKRRKGSNLLYSENKQGIWRNIDEQ